MGRSRHRIFGHALPRREEARHEVGIAPGRGGEDREGVEGRQQGQVGLEIAHLVFGFVHGHEIAGGPDFLGARSEGGLESSREVHLPSRSSGKVEGQKLARARHPQSPALRRELDGVEPGLEPREDHEGRSQGGVPAEVDLGLGSEPADGVTPACAHEERGLRKVVLGRDRLKGAVGQPGRERHHPRRVSAEDAARERVDVIQGEPHG